MDAAKFLPASEKPPISSLPLNGSLVINGGGCVRLNPLYSTGLSLSGIVHDLIAGFTVAAIAIPQCIGRFLCVYQKRT